MTSVKRGYVDVGEGQLHYHAAGEPSGAAPLYCLHATAYSGRTFVPLMGLLSRSRRVYALDTPGYGASDALATPMAVADYADAIAEAIVGTRASDAPVDLLGYHFGSVLAVEIAARLPHLVRRIALLGIPYFQDHDRALWRGKLLRETSLGESFEQFRHRWDYFVTHRVEGMPLARAFDNFVDELRAYPREWHGYRALFAHDMKPGLEKVRAPALVIKFSSPLAPHSEAAARVLANATLCDLMQIHGAPLDLGAGLIAQAVEAFLGERSRRSAGG